MRVEENCRKFLGIEEAVIDIKKDLLVTKEDRRLQVDSLAPDTRYTFNISAKFFDGWGAPHQLVIDTSSHGTEGYLSYKLLHCFTCLVNFCNA